MSNWKIGDRAICITPGSEINGMKVIITSEVSFNLFELPNGTLTEGFAYAIDPGFPPPAGFYYWSARPKNLIPIPDDKHNFERFHGDLKPCDADYQWNKKPKVVTL